MAALRRRDFFSLRVLCFPFEGEREGESSDLMLFKPFGTASSFVLNDPIQSSRVASSGKKIAVGTESSYAIVIAVLLSCFGRSCQRSLVDG